MNTFRKISAVLTLGAITVLGVSACGSDHSDTASDPSTVASNPAPIEAPAPMPSETPSALVSQSTTLPAAWPSDIPVPTGLDLLHVLPSPTSVNGKIAIYYGIADKAAVVSQMTTALQSAGYSQASSTNHGPSISISTWTKGTMKVALNINTATGHVTCSISVNPGE